jgi:hypothetical protein
MAGVSARRILPMTCIQSWRVAQVSLHAAFGRAGHAEWGSVGWCAWMDSWGDLDLMMARVEKGRRRHLRRGGTAEELPIPAGRSVGKTLPPTAEPE